MTYHIQFAVTADCHFIIHIPPLRRHLTGLYRHQTPEELRQRPGLTGDNRGSTGKVLKCLIPPESTGSHRYGPATTGLALGTTGTATRTTGTAPSERRFTYVM
ncbi:hypothetical protein DPMN_172046 [Dreissena polymorpha]|uniref:Uncharacterized protein n=1 Tax=Dreissena polymorpha TaxID=45954 RepID=A0A9D4E093_DREPO|nr:hypothetical protein DPMN_172046 [Dreissena polymorpha]